MRYFLADGIDITVPEFNGSSFIEYPPLKGISKTFKIEIALASKSLNGLILYGGQFKNGKGDFISLNLIRGFLQFRFNLGSGIANITYVKSPIFEFINRFISFTVQKKQLFWENGILSLYIEMDEKGHCR